MDRLKITHYLQNIPKRWIAVFIFVLALMAVIALKAITEGWFTSHRPLDWGDSPALLFFDRQRGCRCALVVYQAADHQINAWSEQDRQGLPILRINLDSRPDLGNLYGVVRAPELMLVDSKGQLIYRQGQLVSDDAPFDLA